MLLQDICALYPCGEGERCIHRGGATCFDANGCDPDDLRLCGETIRLAWYQSTLRDRKHIHMTVMTPKKIVSGALDSSDFPYLMLLLFLNYDCSESQFSNL